MRRKLLVCCCKRFCTLLNSWHLWSCFQLCLAWRLRGTSWNQHESCKNLCFSFTWCGYWGLWTIPIRGNLCFQWDYDSCEAQCNVTIQELPYFPEKALYFLALFTEGYIAHFDSSLHTCNSIYKGVRAPEICWHYFWDMM